MLVKEYADLVGLKSTQAVTERLKNNNPPKAIKSYRKFGNTYDLVVNQKELDKLIERKNKRNIFKNKI